MLQNTNKPKEIKSIYAQIGKLISESEEFGTKQLEVSDLEQNILKGLLEVGLSLLKLGVASRTEEVDNQGIPEVKAEINNKGILSRKYQSIFGELTISRTSLRWGKPITWQRVTGNPNAN